MIEAIYWFFLALLFALVEIETEGKYGWAEKMPTWYKQSRLYAFFNGQKPLTGYHLFMLLFMLMFFHLGFILGLGWTLARELQVLAYYCVFFTMEDFLWFVFNPNYGVKKFKQTKIWWHSKSKWVFGLFPVDYIFGVSISVILFYISARLTEISIFYNYLYFLGLSFALVILAILLAPLYHKIYFKLRKKDQRKNSEIFH